jgi:hypothetical protein
MITAHKAGDPLPPLPPGVSLERFSLVLSTRSWYS